MSPSKPLGKVSAALLDFARPVLDLLPDDAGPAEVELSCRIPWIIWNAVVLEKLGRPCTYLSTARDLIRTGADGGDREAMLALIDALETRKRTERPPDLRVLGEFQAFADDSGQLHLRVSEVSPPPK